MEVRSIPVHTALMPAYCKDFHCVMGACQDNCCDDGWRIAFSKKDYLAVKRAVRDKGLEELAAQTLRRLRDPGQEDGMYAEFRVSEAGRCAFHTPEGLCRLQLECGEATLPKVCRTYPRKLFYTPAGLEYSLSPSCEGVLALLWDLPEGIDFIEEPLPKKDHRQVWPDNPVETRFADVRALWVDALQARALPLSRRLMLLGLLAQQLRELDWNDESALDRWLVQGAALVEEPSLVTGDLERMPRNQKLYLSNCLKLVVRQFSSLKELSGEFLFELTGMSSLKELDMDSVIIDAGRYRELEGKLDTLLEGSEHFMENLMVTIVFHLTMPNTKAPEELWKSYVNLCNLYSFYHFASVCAMGKEATRERLFHTLVHVSRSLIHSPARRSYLRDEFFQNDSATLAHMAILLGG